MDCIMSLEEFRSAVEEFIAREGVSPSAFGKNFTNDPLFVFQLRNGREPRSATKAKVLRAMNDVRSDVNA